MVQRGLAEHRTPGVCVALLGFMVIFAGVMLISLGAMKQDFDTDTIKISGSFCVVGGVCLISAGFAHQFVSHRKWKKRRQQKKERRRKRRAKYLAAESVRSANVVGTNEIVLSVDQISDPGPSSSGVFTKSISSSLHSSWSSLSDIQDSSGQNYNDMDSSREQSVISFDYSIFCTVTSSAEIDTREENLSSRKSADSSKVKRSKKACVNANNRQQNSKDS